MVLLLLVIFIMVSLPIMLITVIRQSALTWFILAMTITINNKQKQQPLPIEPSDR